MNIRRIPGIVMMLVVVACGRHTDAVDSTHSVVGSRPAIVPSDSMLAQLAAAIEGRRVELRIPGAAVAVVTEHRVLMARGFGLRDVERGLPVTSSTLFALGSCTKPFTSLAFAISADSGMLSLDDSPRRFLPWFTLRDSAANAQVNFRDLLSHRTGVRMDDRQGWYERYPTRERLIRFAMSGDPNKPFRSAFQYNNFMYVAAGEALAAAHGTTYADLLHRIIFAPLGMDSTTTAPGRAAASADFSYGYRGRARDVTRERVAPTQMFWLDGIEAAGAIWTNADDIARWLRMLVGGGAIDGERVVADSSLRELLTPHIRAAGGQYGLGWFIEDWHGERLYSHAGGVSGFGALCEFVPSLGLGWAILTNVDDGTLPKGVRDLIYQYLILPAMSDSSGATP